MSTAGKSEVGSDGGALPCDSTASIELDGGSSILVDGASHQAAPQVASDHEEVTDMTVTEGKSMGTADAAVANNGKPLEAADDSVASGGIGSHPAMDVEESVERVEE